MSTVNEQQCACAIKQKSSHNTDAVAPSAYNPSCRDGHEEIAAIYHRLYQCAASFGDDQHILKMPVQHIKDVWATPHKKNSEATRANTVT